MGAVYKARQRTLDRIVALKVIRPAVADDPAFAERFTREARALARLNHPHVVTIHDFGQTDGLYYLVMEYVDGTNLRTLIRDGRLSPQEALAIVPPLCDALQYAHDEGIVHRDIKPENILLDQKGRVKIADFGLAKLLGLGPADVTLTAAHQAMGTLHYMAPEQLERPQTVDHRADIYSLGVTLYEMLTGELPLGRFAPPSRKVQVDVRLDEVVLRALERDPEQRYQHASDVKSDVSRIAFERDAVVASSAPSAVPSAVEHVRTPAKWLLIASILNWVAAPLILAFAVPAIQARMAVQEQPQAIGLLLLIPILAGVMMFAAIKMRRLEAYWLCVTGAVLAMIVTPGNLLGLPIGIWSLVVLSDAEVRNAFHSRGAAPGRFAEWWRTRPPGLWRIAHGMLAVAYLISLWHVFSFSGGSLEHEHNFYLGRPEPWLRVEQVVGVTHSWWVVPGWLLLAAAPGLAAVWADRRLYQIEQRPADSWLSHAMIWSGCFTIATTVGLFSAVLYAQKVAAEGSEAAASGWGSVITLGAFALVGLFVTFYSGARLLRQNLRDAAARGWHWQKLTTGQRRVLQAVLLVIGLLLANICFTFRGGLEMTATAAGGMSEVEYEEYGQFDPWYRSERKVGGTTGSDSREFNLLSGSAFAGLLALCAFYGIIRLGMRPDEPAASVAIDPGDSASMAATASPSLVLAPGAGPAMLALALGYIFSALVMCVGAGLIAYGLLWSTPGWAGLVGGGIGTLIGGAGGMFGVWNHSRQYRGAANIMHAPRFTGFDSATLALGFAGLALLIAVVLLWNTSSYEVRLLFCLLGVLASLQGFGTALWRWSIRQSMRPRDVGAIDPRLYVLAGMMVFSALCMAAGAAMAVIAVVMIPIGSAGFWGWMGGACGSFFGGGGGLLGCWNTYRQMEGRSDMLVEQGRNLLDRCVLAMLCMGLALVIAAVSVSPWASSDMVWGGLLIGGVLTFQSLIFVVLRALLRRGIRQQSAAVVQQGTQMNADQAG
jgi:tRNA A-37 threonylcarbamoyl transferase component Bud32